MNQEHVHHPPYFQLPRILFLFTLQTLSGTYLIHFLVVYFTFKEALFLQRLAQFNSILPFYIAGSLIVALFHSISTRKGNYFDLPGPGENRPPDFKTVVTVLSGGLLMFIGFIFPSVNGFSFMIAAAALLYSLLQISRVYTFNYTRPSWQHPTTAGAIVTGSLLCGLSITQNILRDPDVISLLGKLIFAGIIFQTLIVWSRFRFLSKANAVTYQTVKMMLGTHLLLFAVRFVFGLAMPAVYVFWMVFVSPLPVHPAILMVIVGEVSERILFFTTASSYTASAG